MIVNCTKCGSQNTYTREMKLKYNLLSNECYYVLEDLDFNFEVINKQLSPLTKNYILELISGKGDDETIYQFNSFCVHLKCSNCKKEFEVKIKNELYYRSKNLKKIPLDIDGVTKVEGKLFIRVLLIKENNIPEKINFKDYETVESLNDIFQQFIQFIYFEEFEEQPWYYSFYIE